MEALQKKTNIRLMETGSITKPCPGNLMTKVTGGLLVQTRGYVHLSEKDLKVVSKRKPTKDEIKDMLFAFKVSKHVKSNSIIFAKNNTTVGIGAGQTSRVDAVKIAASKAKGMGEGAIMSSDAFFPFRDGIDEAAKAGITAIIQTGGSVKDVEVIKAADEYNMAMVFTGITLFWH